MKLDFVNELHISYRDMEERLDHISYLHPVQLSI